MVTLLDLLPRHAQPAAPLFTHYDVATGERVELSAITTANWVAKTASWLEGDLEAEPGTRVRIGLPTHWQRFVWLLATWSVGGVVTDTGAAIGLSGPDLVADEPVRLAASLRPLGGRFAQAPEEFLDIAVDVPGQPDVFVPFEPVTSDLLALDLDGERLDHAALLAGTQPDARRLVVDAGPLRRDADLLVAALAGSGSLVTVVGGDPDDLARIAEQERGESA